LTQSVACSVQAIEIGLGELLSWRQQPVCREPVPGTGTRGQEIRAAFSDEVEMSVEK
jgi:hypothetical protein